jgi:hypothetical protein
MKDEHLDQLSWTANIAQFVSFGPDLNQRFSRALGLSPNHQFNDPHSACEHLLRATPEHAVNIRTFLPDRVKSSVFLYKLTSLDDIVGRLRQLASDGWYTIVNETVDVADGGVSGVCHSGIIECAPGDTPRCVEKPAVFRISQPLGVRMLETVYRFRPCLDYAPDVRVEFSIHPLKRGYLHDHTIVWELETAGGMIPAIRNVYWPNRFSTFVGDKVFGLLLAHGLGLPVPHTTVFSRSVAPFEFGIPTGSGEFWMRTSPEISDPGRFPTQRGWRDPFDLIGVLGPDGRKIASVVSQESVEATYSGALICRRDGTPIIEGVHGYGDMFMLGLEGRSPLPAEVTASVQALFHTASEKLGPVRLEWACDRHAAWVLQLHCGLTTTEAQVIVPGEAEDWLPFRPADGLDALRDLIGRALASGAGIVVAGDVGLTSHIGDLIRQAGIPARISASGATSEREVVAQ